MQAAANGEKSIESKLIKQPNPEANSGEKGQPRRTVPVRRLFLDEDG